MSVNPRLYTKALILKLRNLANKLVHIEPSCTTRNRNKLDNSLKSYGPFNHYSFSSYKSLFTKNMIPLIGGIPSYYLSDTKPIKSWKFANIFLKSGEVDPTYIRLKPRTVKLRHSDFKQTICKKIRLRLMRSLLNKNLKAPTITQNILNFKSLTKKLSRFKPLLKRIPAPTYITKWKTSYPLMFTNRTHTNKLLKPQLDITIKTFVQSRSNRRVRRFKKILFRKIKRHTKDKRSVKSLSAKTRTSKQSILTVLSTHQFKSYKNSLSMTTLRPLTNPVLYKSLPNAQHKKYNKISYPVNWDSLSAAPNDRNTNYLSKQNFTLTPQMKTPQNVQLGTGNLLQIKYSLRSINYQPLPTHKLSTSTLKGETLPHMQPRTDKNFIFKNFGIFLTSFIFFNQKKPFTYKYLFKKKIFSFLYPNEVRNTLMARKKKIVFYQLVYKMKHKAKQKTYYSFSSFNKFFINHYKTSLQNTSNASITRELFSNLTDFAHQTHNTPSFANYVSSRDEILYDQNFSYRGVDLSFKRSEVKIPRVRFRPGYQRMWRNARNALKESMGLKFVYQQQLTKCLVRFYKNSNKYSFSRSEMSANRIIMYSRLLPDNPTVDIFINQKLIYLNGLLLHTQKTILVPNDLVQLIVSMWYYIAYRWVSNWTLKRHKKFKKLVYRKGLAGKHKVMKLKKQRSYYTPNWIYLARYDISDVKPFLEVDYFTLSAFVLYEPFTTYYYTPDESPDFRPNIYRMYNWKYIT